ncbi:Cyclin-dependent kinase 20 [Linnemannia zychae]|nr:Cyclin-dependent kinase 20 [Linnemannia zychae]
MAQPQPQSIPALGYPCMAATGNESAALVGLQFDSTAKSSSYALQSYTFSTNARQAIAFTPSTFKNSSPVQPLINSRMVCAGDKASGSFLYIFNDKVYIENSQDASLSTATPISTWNPARSVVAQVAYATTTRGQFQWLGLNNGNWTLFDITAKGISEPVQAQVPSDIPSKGVQLILRETSGNFVVIYNKDDNEHAFASRFTLGATASTPIIMGDESISKIVYTAITNAQDAENDYFFGTSGPTFTALVDSSNLTLISTRYFPGDKDSYVPKLNIYGAATMSSDGKNAFVYGGLSNANSNAWSFEFSNITIAAAPKRSDYIVSKPVGVSDSGAFITVAPVTVRPQEPSKGLSTAAIIGIAVGAVAILLIIGLFTIFQRRNKKIKARAKDQEGLDLAVRDMQAKSGQNMGTYQPRFASTHSLLASEANATTRDQNSISTDRPVENLTLRVPIVRYDGRDVAQSSPFAPLGAVVLSQYRLGQTAVNSKMVVIQLGENVDTAESVTLKWVRDEIVWQREAAMLNHIANPAKIISLHQTMIIPAALEWRHILVLDAHELTLDFMLSTAEHRLLGRDDQRAVAKALLGGLVWCHEKDVVHLSICTGSIVMNEEGQWVLWSFGGSRFLNEAVGPRQGSLIGREDGAVERNLAPELLNARRERRLDTTLSTTMMDAWAAGCVLFEILTGQPLFRTEDAAEQAASGRFNAWKDRLVDIKDANERRVVEGLLVLDPNYRLSLNQAESLFM